LGRQHYHLAVYGLGLRAGLHFGRWAKKMTQTTLVVMDIQLPGQSGLDLARLPRADARPGRLPKIAVTTFADYVR
jgi:CheY-like chemotaxis protein